MWDSAVVPADARPAPVVLGSWPTPLEPAPRLAAAVGLAARTEGIFLDPTYTARVLAS